MNLQEKTNHMNKKLLCIHGKEITFSGLTPGIECEFCSAAGYIQYSFNQYKKSAKFEIEIKCPDYELLKFC